MQEFVPHVLAQGPLAGMAGATPVRLGVKLEGDDGGEWVIQLEQAGPSVREASREDTPFTLVQTVADWRGALWEGRGGAFGAQATALFKGTAALPESAGGAVSAPGAVLPSAAAIQQLGALDGLIRMVVTGGAGGEWSTGFKLGPGPIPAEPKTKIVISDEDARAMQEGALDPMQAFMGGKMKVIGDMALMMQMQAIIMAAAAGSR